jgi:hypothetical protein
MPKVGGVEVEIETADALVVAVDVLVLKHAQASYGVDAMAKERLGLDAELRLPPGDALEVRGGGRVGAKAVVFLGVPDLPDFGYPEIRLFGRRAVSMVASEYPDCQSMALTVHGVGYGLDESACFEAELSGIIDAVGDVSSCLERVSIVETDRRRAERFRHRLRKALPESTTTAGLTPGRAAELADDLRRSAEAAAAVRDHAFVAMPFLDGFEDRFHYAIEPAVHNSGLLCERIDQQAFTGSIPDRIKSRIQSATLVVADLSEANPNVYLEVGFAWGKGVPTVLLCHDDSELKFDVRSERCIMYASIRDLEDRLTAELRRLVR